MLTWLHMHDFHTTATMGQHFCRMRRNTFMKSLRYYLILLFISILILSMTSCQRVASRIPMGSATPESDFPFPISTQPNVMKEILSSTATAMAKDITVSTATAEPQEEEPPASPTEVVIPDTYALQKGEWPTCIARRFNVNISTLLAINGLSVDSKPGVGTKLQIPKDSEWSSVHGSIQLRSHPTEYTVKAGDTIYSIACYYGDIYPQEILDANGIEGYNVSEGQVLAIP